MRRLQLSAVLALAGVLCLTPVGDSGSATARGPFLLVTLPSLGTVTWRCEQTLGRYALGVRLPQSGATTMARLTIGGRVVERVTVDPGEQWRFPASGRVQRLDLTQLTGAGTLQATVTVGFERRPVVSHCFAYSPPNLTVRMTPRR
jgi:hypothetical protein